MTTELVILLTLFVIVILGIFKVPTQSFEMSGPRLGMRIEKHIETGAGFTAATERAQNPITWGPKK